MKYSDLRPTIQTGDQIYWEKPKSLIGEFVTCTHVSGIVRMPYKGVDDHIVVVESNFTTDGVIPVLLSELLEAQHGKGFLLRLNMNPDEQQQYAYNVFMEIGKRSKYDVMGLIEKGLNILGFRKIKPKFHAFGLICSGFCRKMLSDMQWRGMKKVKYQPSPDELLQEVQEITGTVLIPIEWK